MFCVECGSEEEIYGSLCRSCLTSREIVMPPSHIALDMCHGCGKFLASGRWRDLYHVELATNILNKETRTHSQVEEHYWDMPDFPPEKGEHRVDCRSVSVIGGKEFEQAFLIGIRIRVQMCPSCSRQSSNYYEAIIQLRRDGVSARDAVSQLALEGDKVLEYSETLAGNEENAFLSKWGPVPGGMDFYIGSVVLAKNIAAKMRDNYGASIKESNSLVGMRDGQDLYRWTILVRLPANSPGDIVAIDHRLFLVDSVGRKTLVLKGIDKGQVIRVNPDDSKLRQVAKRSELREAVVVSQEGKALQVLDPDSMKTVTVLRPSYLRHLGETVPVVRYRERLHAV